MQLSMQYEVLLVSPSTNHAQDDDNGSIDESRFTALPWLHPRQFSPITIRCDSRLLPRASRLFDSRVTAVSDSGVMRGGKPTAVILSIEEYRKLLERVEDADRRA
jgi:hypothetical protein